MLEKDTLNLLRECDAGVKMGMSSIDETLKFVKSSDLQSILGGFIQESAEIRTEIEKLLHSQHDDGKDPEPMAKSMSWLKTNVKLGVNGSDEAVADLITDGCNMGIKSLSKFLNQYEDADKKAKKFTVKLIEMQEKLAADVRKFL